MTDLEKIRAFIERVKEEHKQWEYSTPSENWCDAEFCDADFPCTALRAVLVLEELGDYGPRPRRAEDRRGRVIHSWAELPEGIESPFGQGSCSCGWPPIRKQRLATRKQFLEHQKRQHVLAKRASLRQRAILRLSQARLSMWR